MEDKSLDFFATTRVDDKALDFDASTRVYVYDSDTRDIYFKFEKTNKRSVKET